MSLHQSDAVTINETWRGATEEIEKLRDGHLWFGSGGTAGKHGVGILLHRKWSHRVQNFEAVHSRLAFLDVCVACRNMRIIVAYFPHCGYSDANIEKLYKEVETNIAEARKKKKAVIMGADCNAEAGGRQRLGKTYGGFGNPSSNARGELLKAWAGRTGMALANSFFMKRWDSTWTHEVVLTKRRRQIDYILVDQHLLQNVTNAEATDEIGGGSDHRAIKICWTLKAVKRRRWQQPSRRKASFKHWQPTSLEEYSTQIERQFEDAELFDQLQDKAKKIDDKCAVLTETIKLAAEACRKEERIEKMKLCDNGDIRRLIARRKGLDRTEAATRKDVSKEIQKAITREMRRHKRARIESILKDFVGLKQIADIKSNGKRKIVSSMIDDQNVRHTDRQAIADVFAAFYEDLFNSRCDKSEMMMPDLEVTPFEPFTNEEVHRALKGMKRGKAGDSHGLVAELLKDGGDSLRSAIAMLFNDVASNKAPPPEAWKESRITVIFKKGDEHKAENYRPITLLPVLYKLFSRMLHARIKSVLEAAQSVDQAGFRSGFACSDHLFAITQLAEKAREYQLPLWICAVDFKKAFDTVEHPALWTALSGQGVDKRYIAILQRLYEGQKAQVIMDKESRQFNILRGTKQGDPISPQLFNAALEDAIGRAKRIWAKKGYGIQVGVGGEDRLTNLRFADDILLIATSTAMIRDMVAELQKVAAGVGLQLHMGKTKILTNEFGRKSLCRDCCDVNGEGIEILAAGDPTMYLGRSLSLIDTQAAELENRISSAWRAFMRRKNELCNKGYPLRSRLRLFEATVTKAALYGSETWVPTAEMARRLSTTQRKMLRWMVGTRRRVDHAQWDDETDSELSEPPAEGDLNDAPFGGDTLEAWEDWIKRATEVGEEELRRAKIEDWCRQQRRSYWRWAGHVARMQDGRWTVQLLNWVPDEGSRRVGRPNKRWVDELEDYIRLGVKDVAQQRRLGYILSHAGGSNDELGHRKCRSKWREVWKKSEDDFVKTFPAA